MNIIYMLMHDKFNYIRCSRTKPYEYYIYIYAYA